MKAKRIYESIIFKSPESCENNDFKKECTLLQQQMRNHYIEEGIYLIDDSTYYSIWAYKLKFMNKLENMLKQLVRKILNGKRQNYATHNFIFNSKQINQIDTIIIKQNFEIPFALCQKNLYREVTSSESSLEIFKKEDLDTFYNSYIEWTIANFNDYNKALKEYDKNLNITMLI